MDRQRALLTAGVAAPVTYLVPYAVAALLNPGFSLTRDAPSALGETGAPNAWIFNLGLVATGLAGVLAATGLYAGLRPRTGGPWLAGATAAATALFSLSLLMAGLFPLPDPLHYGFNASLAGLLVPLFGALTFWRAKGRRDIILALSLAFALLAAFAGEVVADGLSRHPPSGFRFLAMAAVMLSAICGMCLSLLQAQRGQVSSDRLSASPTR